MSIIIDPEFQSLIPPLSADEYTQLEKNIVKDGIRDALVVWPQADGNDILIDGHNRFNISAAHSGIQFQIKRKDFKDRDEAIVWIIDNQLGKRNLPVYDKVKLNDKKREALARIAEKKKISSLKQYAETEDKNSCPRTTQTRQEKRENSTDYKIAKAAGTSEDTVRKVRTIESSGNEEVKQAVRSGDISISQGYRRIVEEKIPKQQKQASQSLEAKQRHKEYEQKKQEGVVSIQDAMQDKEDRDVIARYIYKDILSIVSKTYWIGAINSPKEIESIATIVPENKRQYIIDTIQKIQNILDHITEILRR